MAVDDDRTAEPTNAERIRTVLAAADSLTVVTDTHTSDLVGGGLHAVDADGRLVLRVPADCRLAAEVALAPRGSLSSLLKFTDVAPVAVRDRVRARVTLAGWLTRSGRESEGIVDPDTVELRLDPAHAELETAAGTVTVGLDELALARPDVLAGYEAGMLTHLVDGHRDVLALLARLVDQRLLFGVTRVWPLALDRHGLTLRLEHAVSHSDVRLPFPATVGDPAQVGDHVQALLAAARGCRRRRLPSRP
ncbi:DUF2470 domain-containing protein [Streptomyces sp. NPDC000410]|uniref:DUF2470 domain-containing protein n=1 Tax=Streptomyces sp. NPDC000410 TaxID=3154254 RepID=UPI003331FAFF